MKIAFFDTHHFERDVFDKANEKFKFEITYVDSKLTPLTAAIAAGHDVACPFVNDTLNETTLGILKQGGIRLVALRSAGYNHVDLKAAARLHIPIVRVPEYSPYAVAEHSVALILALNRKIHRAYNRVRESNFSLEGLVGFDLHGKTVGIIGTGRIGSVMAKIMLGFGCKILAYDLNKNEDLEKAGVLFTDLKTIYMNSDIISLHIPLTPQTKHLLSTNTFSQMKKGAIVVNTGRGALIDTIALIESLKSHHIGGACLDVYEEESGIFFQDLSNDGLQDDVLARLLTFPNVLVTSHQGFLTHEALANIASTTLENIENFAKGKPLTNEVLAEQVYKS